ncbi:5-hydroxyisourate hydrolase-like [Mya arenaria]|uniref:5-hydroxyisourate hydrolase-like n=1 Tax=Mya arenaria TaxID=6604 RepID=UPI0022DF5956|nr:5-hydroxyisourate hydrolase-like [Mya arenaria]
MPLCGSNDNVGFPGNARETIVRLHDSGTDNIAYDTNYQRPSAARLKTYVKHINFGAAGPRLTTHVLDTARGTPAGGVPVILSLRNSKGVFEELEQGRTDNDGRCEFLKGGNLQPEVYRFYFDTDLYFRKQNATGFFPYVEVVFRVKAGQDNHYHVPLLLSPHGYTTYHGS